jgi:hypothetical protein
VGNSQNRAIQNYRSRLTERGLARRLAEDGPDASRLRAAVSQTIAGEPPKRGGIMAALRRSPLVGADLDLTRPREEGRETEI